MSDSSRAEIAIIADFSGQQAIDQIMEIVRWLGENRYLADTGMDAKDGSWSFRIPATAIDTIRDEKDLMQFLIRGRGHRGDG